MDAMTGRTGVAETRPSSGGRLEIRLLLPPGGSLIVRTFDRPANGEQWQTYGEPGRPTTLDGPWDVTFIEGGPVLPAPLRGRLPLDWASSGDADAERFAGTATYAIRFDAPEEADQWLLDLGAVAQSASIRLNGRIIGKLVAPPFRIETGALQAEDNFLEIDVTNLAANRIRDLDRRGVEWKKFYDINFVNIDYAPFDASEWPLHPSGLIGPVRLCPLRAR
jgi:hypothetical protein